MAVSQRTFEVAEGHVGLEQTLHLGKQSGAALMFCHVSDVAGQHDLAHRPQIEGRPSHLTGPGVERVPACKRRGIGSKTGDGQADEKRQPDQGTVHAHGCVHGGGDAGSITTFTIFHVSPSRWSV